MKKLTFILSAVFTATLFISCATIKEIPNEKTAAQIIQMGQNSVSAGDYKSALFCYNEAIQRFGTSPSVYAEAKYEVGHVYIKQKKYDKAYETFHELLDLYDSNSGSIPATYKKLCQIGLQQIPEKKLQELDKKISPSEAK